MHHNFAWLRLICWGIFLFTCNTHAALPIQSWQSHGAQVYFVEAHHLPMLDIEVTFSAGSNRDSAQLSGLSSLVHGLLDAGSEGWSEEQIAKKFADVGAILGGEFDLDKASLSLRTLSHTTEQNQSIDLFARILQKPVFPEAVLQREKRRVIAGIQEASTQPDSILQRQFYQQLYGQHPYARSRMGRVDTVSRLRREQLLAFYQKYYSAQGAVIAIIGDVSRSEAAAIADRLLSGLPQASSVNTTLNEPEPPVQAHLQKIAHPAQQAHIALGYLGCKRGDADFFPLYVGNHILGGGGFTSRLNAEVREQRGLAYSVYSYFLPLQVLGPFQISVQTKANQRDETLTVVRNTLATFIREGPTERELLEAKQNITGSFPLRLDNSHKILNYLTIIGFYHLPLDYLDTFNHHVAQVTATQIREVFARRVALDKLVTITVGGDEK